VGDEGGFAPALASTRDALDFIMKSIEQAGYRPGDDVVLALDCAATEYYRDGAYRMEGEGRSFSSEEMVGFPGRTRLRLSDRVDRGRHGRG
jgi:enolase